MGFWSFLPFVADDPGKPAGPQIAPGIQRDWKAKGAPAAAKAYELLPGDHRSTPRAEPSQPSEPTQFMPGLQRWWKSVTAPSEPLSAEQAKKLEGLPEQGGSTLLPGQAFLAGQVQQPLVMLEPDAAARADYEPGLGAQNALAGSGWTLPERKTRKVPAWMLDKNAEQRGLHRHDYMLNQGESALMNELLKEKPGYVAPEQLGVGSAPASGGNVSSRALTWEAYNKLSPEARAAVDFNTALIEAREADFKFNKRLVDGKETVSEAARKEYDAEITKLFGAGLGSDVFAPNTLDLLKGIELNAKGQDLDEFLSLERGVALEDLSNTAALVGEGTKPELGKDQSGLFGDPNEFSRVRSAANQLEVTVEAVELAGPVIDRLMADRGLSFTATVPQSFQKLFGSTEYKPQVGWGQQDAFAVDTPEGQQDKFLRDAYDNLKNPNATPDMDKVWQTLAAANFEDQDYKDFWTYIERRIQTDVRTGWDTGPGRSEAELRKFTGLTEVSGG